MAVHSWTQLMRNVNLLWAKVMPTLHKMVYWCMIPSLFIIGKQDISSFNIKTRYKLKAKKPNGHSLARNNWPGRASKAASVYARWSTSLWPPVN